MLIAGTFSELSLSLFPECSRNVPGTWFYDEFETVLEMCLDLHKARAMAPELLDAIEMDGGEDAARNRQRVVG